MCVHAQTHGRGKHPRGVGPVARGGRSLREFLPSGCACISSMRYTSASCEAPDAR